MTPDADLILVGGGLANGLLALRLRQHGPLRREIGDPACAFLPEPGSRCGIQPT
ncbi:MAG: hypothetical protein H2074_13600, partial [Pseudomonas sp.]|nr:hypothetical protein [Pseudomonas sp.]